MSRPALAIAAAVGIGLAVASGPHASLLVWNASASAAIGLYCVSHRPAATGDLVLVNPPANIAALAAQRHYLPLHVPLIKHLAARVGDSICARGSNIVIDGHIRAARQDFDSAGRPMPRWSGCRRLQLGEVFLLNPDAPHSFDGRYFGPISEAAITGVLSPLWTH